VASNNETGRECYTPVRRFLGPEEVHAEIADCERRHRLSVRIISRFLGFSLDGTEAAWRAFAASLRMVAFRPPDEPG
jgi:hypothetical protein